MRSSTVAAFRTRWKQGARRGDLEEMEFEADSPYKYHTQNLMFGNMLIIWLFTEAVSVTVLIMLNDI
jgi:hypothetical protein